jgi:hypothetical protein
MKKRQLQVQVELRALPFGLSFHLKWPFLHFLFWIPTRPELSSVFVNSALQALHPCPQVLGPAGVGHMSKVRSCSSVSCPQQAVSAENLTRTPASHPSQTPSAPSGLGEITLGSVFYPISQMPLWHSAPVSWVL